MTTNHEKTKIRGCNFGRRFREVGLTFMTREAGQDTSPPKGLNLMNKIQCSKTG
jgi:hypothetical protein